MDHTEKLSLAHDLAARMGEKHGDALLVGGLIGAVARGDDTSFSDLDMVFVARAGSGVEGRFLLFQGVPVHLIVADAAELEAELRGPGLSWPYWMGVLEVLQPMLGDPAHLQRWRSLGMASDAQTFRVTVERLLPALALESYGRIRSCGLRRNARDAPALALELVYELKTALCLLNRRWVTRDYFAGVEQSFRFPLIPAGYAELALRLLDARELEVIVDLAGQLMAAYWRLLAVEGAVVQNYQKLEQLPL